MNKKFEKLLKGVPQSTPPIWFMRQAGRYHSHYQNLRKTHSFEELCKTPELAAKVACGPMEDFDYDIAILFSDILFPLELLGLKLSYNPGPTFENYLSEKDSTLSINESIVEEKLDFQSEALRLTRMALADNKSLVGFVGGPWTILSYGMNIKNEKSFSLSNSNIFIEKLLYDVLFPVIRKNIQMQFDAGAEIVYVFDTNSVQLNNIYYLDIYMERMKSELFLEFNNSYEYSGSVTNFSLTINQSKTYSDGTTTADEWIRLINSTEVDEKSNYRREAEGYLDFQAAPGGSNPLAFLTNLL